MILIVIMLIVLLFLSIFLFISAERHHQIIRGVLLKLESRYNSNSIAVQANPKNQYFAGAMKEDYDIIGIIKAELGEDK